MDIKPDETLILKEENKEKPVQKEVIIQGGELPEEEMEGN